MIDRLCAITLAAVPFFAELLLAPQAQLQKPLPAGGSAIKVQVDMVSLPAVVTTGNGKRVTNLKQEDFQVFEDGVLQTIEGFAAVEEPFAVALMLDISGSTEKETQRIRREAIRYTKLLPSRDKIAVLTFGEEIQMVEEFTSDRQRLASAIEKIRPRGFTALYDAVRRGIREVLESRRERGALVLFTDGVDTASDNVTSLKTLEIAKTSRAPIYSIFFNTHEDARARRYLTDLADLSGGQIFEAARMEDLNPAFQAIARELASQYSIGYYPTNRNHDGKYRKVELKVNRPSLWVQTRKGYWALDDTSKRSAAGGRQFLYLRWL